MLLLVQDEAIVSPPVSLTKDPGGRGGGVMEEGDADPHMELTELLPMLLMFAPGNGIVAAESVSLENIAPNDCASSGEATTEAAARRLPVVVPVVESEAEICVVVRSGVVVECNTRLGVVDVVAVADGF